MAFTVLGVAGLGLAAAVPLAGQAAGPRAFALDRDARAVVAIDVASGRVVGTASLDANPTRLLRTRDGRRLLVLERGQGRDAGDAGFQATTRSAVTVLDAASLERLGRTELGWGLDPTALLSASGDRLTVVCPGFEGRTAADSRPRELVTVMVRTAAVEHRVALPRRVTALVATEDGRTALILSVREQARGRPLVPAEVRIADLTGGAIVQTLVVDGDPRGPVLSADEQYLYLLDRGDPSGSPEKNVNGRVVVLSVAKRALATTADAGSKPLGFVVDERGRQLLLLSSRAPVKGAPAAGELRAIRGPTVAPPVAVPALPIRLHATADGTRLVVVSGDGVTALSLPGLAPQAAMKRNSIGLMETAISADGRRIFASFQQNLWTYDVETGKELARIQTGRFGARLGLAVGAAVLTSVSKSSSRRQAENEGRSSYQYTEYSLRDPNESMAVGPDGSTIYALNRQTGDVTVVDAATGAVVEKVAADGFAIHFLPAAATALVVDTSVVHAIDLATHRKTGELVSAAAAGGAGFNRVDVSPDGRYAVVSGDTAVLSVSGSAGKPVGMLQRVRRLADLVVVWPGR